MARSRVRILSARTARSLIVALSGDTARSRYKATIAPHGSLFFCAAVYCHGSLNRFATISFLGSLAVFASIHHQRLAPHLCCCLPPRLALLNWSCPFLRLAHSPRFYRSIRLGPLPWPLLARALPRRRSIPGREVPGALYGHPAPPAPGAAPDCGNGAAKPLFAYPWPTPGQGGAAKTRPRFTVTTGLTRYWFTFHPYSYRALTVSLGKADGADTTRIAPAPQLAFEIFGGIFP